MTSARLSYRALTHATLDEFHRLVQDRHVRRFLMDGHVFPREWSEARVHESIRLFEQRRVGLWLTFERQSGTLVGFCGFLGDGSAGGSAQLVYALVEQFTGIGYATEMAAAALGHARQEAGLEHITASVDAANVASVRVLEKLGFRLASKEQGTFGDLLIFACDQSAPAN